MSGPRSCLVLGGTGYLGRAICERLASENICVAFTYYKNDSLAATMEKEFAGSKAYQMNGRSFDSVSKTVRQAYENFDSMDALVQCIGLSNCDSYNTTEIGFLDLDEAIFYETIETLVGSTFAACQSFLNMRKEMQGGNIILLGSTIGVKLMPSPIHFAAASGAIAAMARSLAKEMGKYKICVNHLALGIMEDGAGQFMNQEARKEYLKHSCLRRLGSASEVAEQVLWYVTENTYITGRSICLDGGL